MSMMTLQTSNPAIRAAQDSGFPGYVTHEGTTATFKGVADKTTLLVGVAVVVGALAYAYLPATGGVIMISGIVAAVVCLGVGYKIVGSPAMAPVLAPLYALVEGVFLGLMTRALDLALGSAGVDPAVIGGSLALPAFVITISCVAAVVGLMRLGVIKPTAKFRGVLSTLTLGVAFAYLAMFVLSFFGIQVPFLSLGSALQGGQAAMIGIGLNVAILGLASLWLVVDAGEIQGIVDHQAPKYMEWYGAFTLMVTLAWIYYEALKLAFRLALMFSRRD